MAITTADINAAFKQNINWNTYTATTAASNSHYYYQTGPWAPTTQTITTTTNDWPTQTIANYPTVQLQQQAQQQWGQLLGATVRFAEPPQEDEAMLGLSKLNAAAKEAGGAEPQAKTWVAEIDKEFADEYGKLAEELGVNTDAIKVERFKNWLNHAGILCYDYADVAAYLTKQYGEGEKETSSSYGKATWGWVALREADLPTRISGERGDGWIRKNGNLQYNAGVYKKAIPLPVLHTVKRIVEAFPTAQFYVSDEVMMPSAVKDPFLMVRYGAKWFVVEKWAEPGFRGRYEE